MSSFKSDLELLKAAAWDESKHPRVPAGVSDGGRWAAIGGVKERLGRWLKEEVPLSIAGAGGAAAVMSLLGPLGVIGGTLAADMVRDFWSQNQDLEPDKLTDTVRDLIRRRQLELGKGERDDILQLLGYVGTLAKYSPRVKVYYAVVQLDEPLTKAWDESKHPRDPKGTSTGGQFRTEFHGTSAKNLESVLKNGLRPISESDGVWLTSDAKLAASYAGNGVVFKIEVPEEAITGRGKVRIFQSEKGMTPKGYGLLATKAGKGIPPEWITGYYPSQYNAEAAARDPYWTRTNNRGVFALGEFVPIKKYSPDQPRHPKGSPDGGQWVDEKLPPDEEELRRQRVSRLARLPDDGLPSRPANMTDEQWAAYVQQIKEDEAAEEAWWDEYDRRPYGQKQWAPPETLYHGTSDQAWASIQKEGLKSSPPTRNFGTSMDPHLYAGSRAKSIYLTTSLNDAHRFAVDARYKTGSAPIILKVDFPKEAEANLIDDEQWQTGMRYKGDIPASWISLVDARPGMRKGRTLYTVVFCTGVAKYSPDQARAPKGTPEGGQWASMFHGTSGIHVASIMSSGLKPGGGNNFRWGTTLNEDMAQMMADIDGHATAVYLTPDLGTARAYSRHRGDNPTVLEVKVPTNDPNLERDPGDNTAFLYRGVIPPAYISVLPDLHKAGHVTVYVVIPGVEKYSPDQARAPKGDPEGGQWVAEGEPYTPTWSEKEFGEVTVYHGSASDIIDDVMKNGLKPGGSKGADETVPEDQRWSTHTDPRRGSVFLAYDQGLAEKFADLASELRDSELKDAEPIIFEVVVPTKEALRALRRDERSGFAENDWGYMRFEGHIPAKWIRGYYRPGMPEGEIGYYTAKGRKIYAVIFVAKVAKNDMDLWDPDEHPRHPAGSSQGGEFRSVQSLPIDREFEEENPLHREKTIEELAREKLKGKGVVVGTMDTGWKLHAKGEGLVRLQLSFDAASKQLHLGWAEVENTLAGHEAAKEVMQTVYDTAIASGAESIGLMAGLESGGYVWAKMGFDIDESDLLVDDIVPRLVKIGPYAPDLPKGIEPIAPELYHKAMAILDKDGPEVGFNIAGLDEPISEGLYKTIVPPSSQARGGSIRPTLGKALLLGQEYEATLHKDRFDLLRQWAVRKGVMQKSAGTLHLSDVLLQMMENTPSSEEPTVLRTEKYSPRQPRAPKGNPDGGQWVAADWKDGALDELCPPSDSAVDLFNCDQDPDITAEDVVEAMGLKEEVNQVNELIANSDPTQTFQK